MNNLTRDTLFQGSLHCWQEKEGYRFSIDSVLLSHFCGRWKKANILDMGTGCGILGLLLLYRNIDTIDRITGIEFQPNLVDIAKKNSKENGFSSKFEIVHGDYRNYQSLFQSEYFTHIICNPPFYKKGNGRLSANHESLLARHQDERSFQLMMDAAFFLLKNRGEMAMVYPSDHVGDLIYTCRKKRIEPKYIRFVYSYPGAERATLVLLMCRKNGGKGSVVQPPLYIYREKNGSFTEEVQQMYIP